MDALEQRCKLFILFAPPSHERRFDRGSWTRRVAIGCNKPQDVLLSVLGIAWPIWPVETPAVNSATARDHREVVAMALVLPFLQIPDPVNGTETVNALGL
jgi:hypothetical protein